MTRADIVVPDIEVILDQLQDLALTDAPLVQIDQAQAVIVEKLNAAYAATEHLPEAQRAEAQANLMQVWQHAEAQLAQSRDQVDLLRQAGAATAVLVGQRDRYADELSDLTEAIFDIDTENAMVADLVNAVEANTMSWFGDEVVDELYERAYGKLIEIDGADYRSRRRFLDRLMYEDGDWTEEQKFLLAGLLGTFRQQVAHA